MKRLILLLDGTWNSDDAANPTNIMRLRKLVEAGTRGESLPEGRQNDGIEQRIYYDNGVGTAGGIDRFLGGVLGVGLSENVRQAYRFLSAFYQSGDEIYVFGFSRGAFTARSLAGFVAAAGLLRKEHCDAPTLKPDSPLMEAVLLVYRTRNFVPVVDPASKRLIGVVSTWHILAQLEGSK